MWTSIYWITLSVSHSESIIPMSAPLIFNSVLVRCWCCYHCYRKKLKFRELKQHAQGSKWQLEINLNLNCIAKPESPSPFSHQILLILSSKSLLKSIPFCLPAQLLLYFKSLLSAWDWWKDVNWSLWHWTSSLRPVLYLAAKLLFLKLIFELATPQLKICQWLSVVLICIPNLVLIHSFHE